MTTAALIDEFAGIVGRLSPGAMPDQCYVQDAHETKNARGGVSRAPADAPQRGPIACRMTGIITKKGAEGSAAGGSLVSSATTYLVELPAIMPDGTPIVVQLNGRLRVLARGPIPERLLEVLDTPTRDGVTLGVLCQELTG